MPAPFKKSLTEAEYRREERAAFSLVEAVVAIVIIAILIVFASRSVQGLTKLKEKTRCVANLHSLGTAALAYAAEHNNNLVPFRMERGGNPPGMWFDHLHQYIGRKPGREGRVIADGVLQQYPGWKCPAVKRDYHINRICGWNDGTNALPAGYLKLGQGFQKLDGSIFQLPGGPSKTAWFADPSEQGQAFQFSSYKSGVNDFIGFPHVDLCNVLFMDGHVESVSDPGFRENPAVLQEQRWIDFFGYKL